MQRIASRRRRNPDMSNKALIKTLTGADLSEEDASFLLFKCSELTPLQVKTDFGLTPAQVKKLMALGKVYNQIRNYRIPPKVRLAAPDEVYDYIGPLLVNNEVESFMCLPLNARSQLIGKPLYISKGDVDGTDAGPRAFFRAAVRVGAVTAIAVHNHPTGSPEPSAADHAVTKRLVEAGRSLDVALVDHIIVAASGYVSLRRQQPHLFTKG
jgi:DNA repair protein RadC